MLTDRRILIIYFYFLMYRMVYWCILNVDQKIWCEKLAAGLQLPVWNKKKSDGRPVKKLRYTALKN